MWLKSVPTAPDILRTPARRKAERHVARLGQRLKLSLKQHVIAEIVADAGDGSGITRQRDCRKGLARRGKAAQKLSDQMARLRSAAAVAERYHFMSFSKRPDQNATDLFGLPLQFLNATLDHIPVRSEVLRDETCLHINLRYQSEFLSDGLLARPFQFFHLARSFHFLHIEASASILI